MLATVRDLRVGWRVPGRMRNDRVRPGFTLVELLVVIAIIAVVVGLTLSAVQRVRAAAARADCQNRIHQIALALHNYHNGRHGLPPGHRSPAHPDGMPYSGWAISLLPFLEQSSLAVQAQAAYRADPNPFHNPPHSSLNTVVPAFICPMDSRITTAQAGQRTGTVAAFTSYLGVAGRNAATIRDGLLFQDSLTRLTDIPDGTSNTLLLGERPPSRDYQFGWWYAGTGMQNDGEADSVLGVRTRCRKPGYDECGDDPYHFQSGDFKNNCDFLHFWSLHPGGANFAFADGSVRFLKYSADPIMPALATRAGGEAVAVPD